MTPTGKRWWRLIEYSYSENQMGGWNGRGLRAVDETVEETEDSTASADDTEDEAEDVRASADDTEDEAEDFTASADDTEDEAEDFTASADETVDGEAFTAADEAFTAADEAFTAAGMKDQSGFQIQSELGHYLWGRAGENGSAFELVQAPQYWSMRQKGLGFHAYHDS